jgi:hypothetical protein
MPLPSPSNNSPWPLQTQPPSQSRKRRILSPLVNRALFARQDVFNQSGVGMSSPLLCSHVPATRIFPPLTMALPFSLLRHDFFPFLVYLSVQHGLIKYPLNLPAAAETQCQYYASNSQRSCFPTADTIVPQHDWATFVCAYHFPYLHLFPTSPQSLVLICHSIL